MIFTVGFEGVNRTGKGTQIGLLRTKLELQSIPTLVLRGNGSREAQGSHKGDPLSAWWDKANDLRDEMFDAGWWVRASVRLAREYLAWREYIFPRFLERTGNTDGIILVDRTVLSAFMLLLENGDTDWRKLYPPHAGPRGTEISGELVCPDLIFNFIAPAAALLPRLAPDDPKHDFRKGLIERNAGKYAIASALVPPDVRRRIHELDASLTEEVLHESIVATLGCYAPKRIGDALHANP
ncbi:MAG: hypothetical protein V4682_00520 [Patescibacteria group bacterium]